MSRPGPRGPRRILPFAEWPAGDRGAWIEAMRPGDMFEDGGKAAHWSAASRSTAQSGYGRWLMYIRRSEPAALVLAAAERVTAERVRRFLRDGCSGLKPSSAWNYAKAIYDTIRVMAPDGDWGWLKALVARLERENAPPSRHGRLIDPARLSALGYQLMDSAAAMSCGHRLVRENQYRDGLLIALLAARPLRRRNITGIRIGKNLMAVGEGFLLVFSDQETKNHRPIEMPVPPSLVPYLRRYLDEIRPRFPGAQRHDGLWASEKGHPMDDGTIYDRVRLRTRRAFDVAVNLHSFRDSAATLLAESDAEGLNNARDMLGHVQLETTERHYIHADRRKAIATYQLAVETFRKQHKGTHVRPMPRRPVRMMSAKGK